MKDYGKILEEIKGKVNSYNQISEQHLSEITDKYDFTMLDFTNLCMRISDEGIDIVAEDDLTKESTISSSEIVSQIKTLYSRLSVTEKCKCLSELALLIENIEPSTTQEKIRIDDTSEKERTDFEVTSLSTKQIESPENGVKYDFNIKIDMAFTKPISITYRNIAIRKNNWTDLYVEFLKLLCRTEQFMMQIMSLTKRGYTTISNAKDMYQLRSPKQITSDIFVESNMDTTDKIRHIKMMIDFCGIPYSDVELWYIKKK